jgi:hypothetical protein
MREQLLVREDIGDGADADGADERSVAGTGQPEARRPIGRVALRQARLLL